MPACDELVGPACVAEHLLFLLGQIETVVDECLGDREAECEAQERLVDLGLATTSDCRQVDDPPPVIERLQ